MKKKQPVERSREVETFLEMLQAERGASQNTLDAYGRDLDDLQVFLARRRQKPAAADTPALRAYLKALDYLGMTPRTVARRLSVLRQFYRFLLAERMREDDPARAALRGNLLLELFRATGINIPTGTTKVPEQVAGGRPVASQTLQALQSGANGRRRAETALLASLALGESSLGDLAPSSAGYIVRCLRAVSEDEAARLFAIEVAIAYGL